MEAGTCRMASSRRVSLKHQPHEAYISTERHLPHSPLGWFCCLRSLMSDCARA